VITIIHVLNNVQNVHVLDRSKVTHSNTLINKQYYIVGTVPKPFRKMVKWRKNRYP